MPELKIIYGPTHHSTKIFVDDTQIGCVQEVRSYVSTDGLNEIEMTFPMFPGDDPNCNNIRQKVQQNVKLVEQVPGVKIKYNVIVNA